MSEHFTIDREKQARLQRIIQSLHAGRPVAEVKKEFARLIDGVSAAEVAEMEQALIDGGMPVEEVQRLCEVHVEVFKSSLGKSGISVTTPGHPLHTMQEENRQARRHIRALKKAVIAWRLGLGEADAVAQALEALSPIIIHYTRKENQLFPYLERVQFTGPSRVMWGKHDEIRTMLKEARQRLGSHDKSAIGVLHQLVHAISRMIFMEEHILFPEAQRRLSDRDWAEIRLGEDAIGFAWIRPGALYDPHLVLAGALGPGKVREPGSSSLAPSAPAPAPNNEDTAVQPLLELATGQVSRELLNLALTTMPVDISIVDDQDRVVYYSDSPHRLFPRSPAVIGRAVQNCHPQKSVATVNRILDAFKKKEKSKARFWLEMDGRFILIEYHALYNAQGRYMGTLEFSQDLTELRALEGQRRLLDWD